MTLGEGKKIVLKLLDEYSSGGAVTEDRDINAKMNEFFDLAQKNVAQYKKIIKSCEVELRAPQAEENGYLAYEMPDDFLRPFRIWNGKRVAGRYPWRNKKLLVPAGETGVRLVEYVAMPQTITDETEDSYQFEVEEDAAACMPYFVAAQQLVVDLILDPAPLLALYDRMLAGLNTVLPGSSCGGVRQEFYREART
ncbi:MAG: hypothetical protein HFF09_06610 [Oscillospiraceae bacterium]|nr:hypothetical protein [Oscillospiraceae bacterium]